jgi:DNA polymerase-3 subunit beta
MKCTVNAGDLSNALRGPCDRAKPHAQIPILKSVRAEAKDSRLFLLGHDLDSSSESSVEAEVEAPGACAIPAEPLARLVGGLPKGAHIVIEIVGTDAIIKSGRSRYKLPILPASDMPAPLSAEGGFRVQMSAADLEQAFVRPRPAMNLKDNRSICHGVYLHNEDGKIVSAATSGYMLMRFPTDIDAGEFKGAIIPRTATDEIIKIGAGEVVISDRIISIASGNTVYSSKLIEAIFPESYRRMILTEGPRAAIYREAAIECLSRLRAIGDFSGSDLVDLTVGDGELTISMVGMADGSETIECDGGQGAFACLRSGQLLEALKSMTGDRVEFLIPSERQPFRIIDPSEPLVVNVVAPCATKTERRSKAA